MKNKIHFRGKRITFEEQQEHTYLQKYEDFHSYCGYLYLKRETKSYTEQSDKVTCNRCLRIMFNPIKNISDTATACR